MLRLAPLLLAALPAVAEDWTRFRGPNGSGISTAKGFPVEFNQTRNMAWRTPVRPGKSSPVLAARHVFLTSFDDGKLYTSCYDRGTGKLLWERSIDKPREEQVNKLNHPAGISPVTDGENVYAFFKDFGLVSYDAAGKLRWQTPLGPFVTSMGLGASPILAGDSVVILADQLESSFIAAFDRTNGEMKWKTPREEGEGWATPLLYTPPAGAPQILTIGRGLFGAHSVSTGKRLASVPQFSPAVVASPVLSGDVIYGFGYGNDEPPAFSTRLARLDKNGDGKLDAGEYGDDAFLRSIARYNGNRDLMITEDEWDQRQKGILGHNGIQAIKVGAAPRNLWKTSKTLTGVIPSPLIYQGLIYVVKNGGVLAVFDAETGRLGKEARLADALGGYSASPVAAEEKVYFANEDGKIAVVRAGAAWDVVQVNDLGEPCFATPALSQGQIYIRTGEALYRFSAQIN